MISCGEASGDLYAGALARALQGIDPTVEVFGFGGPHLREAGAELVSSNEGFAVTGLVEPLVRLRHYWELLRDLREAARSRRPDVFVAIDYPDFHFRLLPAMHELGIPVVYYISPQLWAWRPWRINVLRRYVRRMLVIFPFELDVYQRAGVPVEFVGHPLIDLVAPAEPGEAWLARHGLDPGRPVVALLPGSRTNEVRRILPVLLEARRKLAADLPGVQCVVARAPSLDDELFATLADAPGVAVVTGDADGVLAAADVVATASGTATVQTALHGRPMVIVYRLSPVTYAIGRAFVRVPHVGMVNLVAGRRIVPELIQGACTPENIARELRLLLTDEARARQMRDDLAGVRAALGGPGASQRAAEAVLKEARREET